MTQQEKRRLYIIGALVVAAVILLLLFRRGAAMVAGNTVINQGGEFNVPGISPFDLGDLPPLDIPGQRASSRGCAVCYSGYGRIVAPAAPTPAPTVIEQNSYIALNLGSNWQPAPPPPATPPRVAMSFNQSAPASTPWWNNCTAGRCF